MIPETTELGLEIGKLDDGPLYVFCDPAQDLFKSLVLPASIYIRASAPR